MQRFLHLLLCACVASFATQATAVLQNETKGLTVCLGPQNETKGLTVCLGPERDETTRKMRVGLYLDVGCRGGGVLHWARLLKSAPELDFRMVDGREVLAGRLSELDVLVMPGGGGFERYGTWGEEGCAKIRDFVRGGGAYFGTCAGLAVALNEPQRIRMLPFRRDGNDLRGGMDAAVKLLPRAAELTGLKSETRFITYHNGPVPVPADPVPGVAAEILGTYDCNLMQKGREKLSMHGRPALVWATYGRGRMFIFGCHPEYRTANHDLIAGGFRALTGRAVTFPPAPRKTRPLRVLFYASEIDSGGDIRAVVRDALTLDARPDVDVQFATGDAFEAGLLDHVDKVVLPGLRMKRLSARARRQLEVFKTAGGTVLDTGRNVK